MPTTYPALTTDQLDELIEEKIRSGNADTLAEEVRYVLKVGFRSKPSVTSANPTLDVAINGIEKTPDNKFQLKGDLEDKDLIEGYYGVNANRQRGFYPFPTYDVWTLLKNFTATALSTVSIGTTSDLSSIVKANLPIRWQVAGVKFYGIVESVTSSQIVFCGEPCAGIIEALWIGTPANIAVLPIDFADKTLNATSTNALTSESTNGNYLPVFWTLPSAKLVKMNGQISNKGTGANPAVNVRLGGFGTNVFTADMLFINTLFRENKNVNANFDTINPNEELALRVTTAGTGAKKGMINLFFILI